MKIDQFKNEFRFLSNFYRHKIYKNGIEYSTVEHFFQAFKAKTRDEHLNIADQKTATLAKAAGRKCSLREDWEEVKEEIMYEALRLKFKPGTKLCEMLLATDPAELIEGNHWRDRYWGVDLKTGEGKNRLGVLLMQLRSEILAQQQ